MCRLPSLPLPSLPAVLLLLLLLIVVLTHGASCSVDRGRLSEFRNLLSWQRPACIPAWIRIPRLSGRWRRRRQGHRWRDSPHQFSARYRRSTVIPVCSRERQATPRERERETRLFLNFLPGIARIGCTKNEDTVRFILTIRVSYASNYASEIGAFRDATKVLFHDKWYYKKV